MASQGPKGDENNEKSIANRETEGQFVEKKANFETPLAKGKEKSTPLQWLNQNHKSKHVE